MDPALKVQLRKVEMAGLKELFERDRRLNPDSEYGLEDFAAQLLADAVRAELDRLGRLASVTK